jgi:flap endonuclease-1
MDSLAFATPLLVRNFSASEASKKMIKEFNLEKVLLGLDLNQDEFIDLCILFGCDYCPTIKQIGPKKAFELIKKYKTIEKIAESFKGSEKYVLPSEDYLERVKITRTLFKNPKVTPCEEIELKWTDVDEKGVLDFLVGEKQFDEKKILNVIERVKKSRKVSNQGRISDFFQIKEKSESEKKEIEKKKLEKKKLEKKKKDAEKRELQKKKKIESGKDKKRKKDEDDDEDEKKSVKKKVKIV